MCRTNRLVLLLIVLSLASVALAAPGRGREARQAERVPLQEAPVCLALPSDLSVDPQIFVDHLLFTQLFRDAGVLPEAENPELPDFDAEMGDSGEANPTTTTESLHRGWGACCVTAPDGTRRCLMTSLHRCAALQGR